jgi:hypothetical protein
VKEDRYPSGIWHENSRLARRVSPDEVESVVASMRANPHHDARDYAMLLLMAALACGRQRSSRFNSTISVTDSSTRKCGQCRMNFQKSNAECPFTLADHGRSHRLIRF